MTDAERATIRAAVRELSNNPRFKGRHFGPDSALEVLVQLERYLRDREIRWPAREQTGAADEQVNSIYRD